jgi:hypothetical protein
MRTVLFAIGLAVLAVACGGSAGQGVPRPADVDGDPYNGEVNPEALLAESRRRRRAARAALASRCVPVGVGFELAGFVDDRVADPSGDVTHVLLLPETCDDFVRTRH